MIKIIDNKDKKSKTGLPPLPFFTKDGDDFYLYFNKEDGTIGCVSVSDHVGEITSYDDLSDLESGILSTEEILEVELHVVR